MIRAAGTARKEEGIAENATSGMEAPLFQARVLRDRRRMALTCLLLSAAPSRKAAVAAAAEAKVEAEELEVASQHSSLIQRTQVARINAEWCPRRSWSARARCLP